MSKCVRGQKHISSVEVFSHVETHDGKEETLTTTVHVCGRCGRLLKEKKKRKIRILRRR